MKSRSRGCSCEDKVSAIIVYITIYTLQELVPAPPLPNAITQCGELGLEVFRNDAWEDITIKEEV